MKQSDFEFTPPRLIRLAFQENGGFLKEKFHGITLNSTTTVNRSESSNHASVQLDFLVGRKTEEEPFFAEASMVTNIRWEGDYEEETVEAILSSNAPALLLSYLRPLISTVTGSSHFSHFDIPFLDFTDNKAVMQKPGGE